MHKADEGAKKRLCDLYQTYHVTNIAQFGEETNKKFFRYAVGEFEDLTEKQMLGILVARKVYNPTQPRTPAKKGGRRKSDYIEELTNLVGEELASVAKLTIPDIEILIGALKKGVDTTPTNAV